MRSIAVLVFAAGLLLPCAAEESRGGPTDPEPETKAAAPANPLKRGDRLPSFECETHLGEVWKSAEHSGNRFLVVYFFPAAFTSGCTDQACVYRDLSREFAEAEIEVVGISGDQAAAQQLFADKYDLRFPLLHDEDGRIARLFGVPLRKGNTIERTLNGVTLSLERGVTASRWTFVFDREGRVVSRIPAVDPEKDAGNVLRLVRRIAGQPQS